MKFNSVIVILFLVLKFSIISGQEQILKNRILVIDSLYTNRQYSLAIDSLKFLIITAQEVGSSDIESQAYFYLAKINHNLFHYSKAIILYKAYKECREQANLQYDSFYYHRNLAICYASETDRNRSISHYDSAKLYLDTSNYHETGNYYGSMAYFFGINDHDSIALKLTKRGLDYLKKTNNKSSILYYQYDMAFYNEKLKRHQQSILHLDTVLFLAHQLNDTTGLWMGNACKGINEIKLKQYEKGINSLEKAGNLSKIKAQSLCCANDVYTALGYAKLGQLDKTNIPLEKALSQLPEVTSVIDLYNIYEALSEVYEIIGNDKQALYYYKKYKFLKDTISDIKYNQHIAEQEVKLKYHDLLNEKIGSDNDQKLQYSKNHILKQVLFASLFGVACLLIIVLYYYRKTQYYKYDQKKWELAFDKPTHDSPPNNSHQQDTNWINTLRDLVVQNINNEHFKTKELSELLNLSPYELNLKLKNIIRMTGNKFIRTVRIEKAKELLIGNNMHVSEIAYQLGFSDPAYFSRVFKAATGVSPKNWRTDNV